MRIEHRGKLIDECALNGETRKDGVYPAHPNGIRVSRNRWIIVYATRGFRRKDDDRSIIYQLRRDAPDGPVIKEGRIAQSINDWDPFGDGGKYVRQYGSPVAFGVPRGTLIEGHPVPHANVFAVKWRVLALAFAPGTDRVVFDRDLHHRTQGVCWCQFRLNDREDDIEYILPPTPFRQKGYESGPDFCELPQCQWMNQTFIQPVPYNADCSQWVDCNHVDGFRVAAIKHIFNPNLGRYEWTQCGPYLFDRPTGETSVLRYGDDWVIAARLWDDDNLGVAWLRTRDPFSSSGQPLYQRTPSTNVPRTVYLCPDGVVRVFTGDASLSPYGDSRNPLYAWDVDPERDFAVSSRRIVYDCVAAGLDTDTSVRVDMCKLVPAAGARQLLVHRIGPRTDHRLTEQGKADGGIYHAWLTYERPDPEVARAQTPWTFPGDNRNAALRAASLGEDP